MIFEIPATDENEDWLKGRTWEFGMCHTPEDLQRVVGDLAHFMTLAAARPMPAELRSKVEEFLAGPSLPWLDSDVERLLNRSKRAHYPGGREHDQKRHGGGGGSLGGGPTDNIESLGTEDQPFGQDGMQVRLRPLIDLRHDLPADAPAWIFERTVMPPWSTKPLMAVKADDGTYIVAAAAGLKNGQLPDDSPVIERMADADREQVQYALSVVATLHEHDPVTSDSGTGVMVNLWSASNVEAYTGARGVHGFTSTLAPRAINLQTSDVLFDAPKLDIPVKHFMPIVGTESDERERVLSRSAVAYFATHEYGHLLGYRQSDSSKGVLWQNNVGNLSRYGATGPEEGVAEAYAEWRLSGGRSRNMAAMSYAAFYGWNGSSALFKQDG